MANRSAYFFTVQTLKFCIAGFFIPGFTAFAFFGCQMLFTSLGIQCDTSWEVLWGITFVADFLVPSLFYISFKRKIQSGQDVKPTHVVIFNLITYISLQCSLASFFTDGYTLCNVIDGQNGLEFVFTAWLALPIMIVISLIFDVLRESF